ncbi:BTAD domain-containing putative transcriptional regulator [Streptomyces syringium]|uniref:AfsR/SARP family transcriptional regulator n=1 Tax=Streptomyces syringium TaxID=76729 RepID=UPI0034143A06
MTDTRGNSDVPRQLTAEERPAPAHRPAQRTPGRVTVALLGGFRLTVDGRDVELPGGAQRLVAALALSGRMSRSRLAGTLWPETEEHRALARLRTGIWRVNQAAPELVVTPAGEIALHTRAEVDVRDVVDRSLRVLHGGEVDATAWSPGEDAGDLLPDWEDEWLADARERLRQMRLHVMETVAERLCETGSYGLAIEVALTVLRADMLRESAHRVLVRVHLAEGNLGEAWRAYETCVHVLDRELGVRPTRATSDLLAGRPPGVRRRGLSHPH